jgi:hypothetical protein
MVTAYSQLVVRDNWGGGGARKLALVEVYRGTAVKVTRKDYFIFKTSVAVSEPELKLEPEP